MTKTKPFDILLQLLVLHDFLAAMLNISKFTSVHREQT